MRGREPLIGGGAKLMCDGSEEFESSAVLSNSSPGIGNSTYDFTGRAIGDVRLFLHLHGITSPCSFNH